MTLAELIASFRVDAMDRAEPYLWDEDTVTRWLNEAQEEAAVRGRLLLDDSTPAVTTIAVQAGKASYALHPKVYEIAHLRWQPSAAPHRARPVVLVTREWMDRKHPGWRHRLDGDAMYAIQTERDLRLVPVPREDGVLVLEAYRLPLKPMGCDGDKPEIHAASHAYLVYWALYRAFSQPDADGFDPQRAAMAEAAFTKYFGARPDSDLRRSTRQDLPQVNETYIF
ncbi:DUF6682 family protein [Comamonas sp. w2-DMI]|uniref:phage adaptor protein n=1 Tax=Comamonas sp. w2-DMI TaxID=3126391 RepID=UPI0032E38A5F